MKNILVVSFLTFFLGACKRNDDGSVTTIPTAPSDLIGTAMITSHQINLEWKDNSTNESGFKIERKVGTGSFISIATQTTDITKYSDANLNSNTDYTYRIYSYNNAGKSFTYSNELTITTGTQIWMDKNLNVTTYRNGDQIPQVTDQSQWMNLTTGAWCYYNNDPVSDATYGKLYNWHAVNDPRGLAPLGWHVASEAEWGVMLSFLGGGSLAGGKLKSITGWQNPNIGATNSSGFSAFPGGYRRTVFSDLNSFGYWWTSTPHTAPITAGRRALSSSSTVVYGINESRQYGYSVRCIKD